DWVTLGTSYDGGRGLAYDFRGRTMHGKGAVRDEMFWPDAWHPGERIDFHSKSHMDLLFLDRYFVSRDPVFGPLLETFVSRLRPDIPLYQFSDTSRAAGRPLIWAARAFYTRPDVRAKIVDYASREVNRQYQEWPGHRIPAGRPVR